MKTLKTFVKEFDQFIDCQIVALDRGSDDELRRLRDGAFKFAARTRDPVKREAALMVSTNAYALLQDRRK